jgi:predicted regulator of Ras-like GTPase activity (Roadblock/LC7/MglB family)
MTEVTPAVPTKETPVNPDASANPQQAVLSELRLLRNQIGQIDGTIVASTDGLVIAHDIAASQAYGVEPDAVAAIAAVNLGLSQRIADTANYGILRETVIRGTFGQVVTYAAGDRGLLTVIVRDLGDLSALNQAARGCAGRLALLLVAYFEDPPVMIPVQRESEPGPARAARPASSRATGTRNGEQET